MTDTLDVSLLSSRIFLLGCVTVLVVLLVGVVLNALFLHVSARLLRVESGPRKALHATLLTWLFGFLAALFTGAVLAGSSWQLAMTVNFLTSAAAGAAAILIAYGIPFGRALAIYLAATLLMAVAVVLAAALGLAILGGTGSLEEMRARADRVRHVLDGGDLSDIERTETADRVEVPVAEASGLVGRKVEIELSNGETARGTLLAVEGDVLVVRERIDGGSVELRLRVERVVGLYRVRSSSSLRDGT